MIPVRLLPRDLQPTDIGPWVFQPVDHSGKDVGEPIAIPDDDLHLKNFTTMSPSGTQAT
ncbi:MAG: hypothetical protein ACYTG5_23415 [Planctomycetota bacterium]|jgi:hypothetical protein